ncbi:DsbC family protein [Candidatus Nitrotoga sp. M5]|uniref:DsbC family protein n=1 Tax=Candidatus Nitrotoga sp. M5 TaxID=2890409 RepID=UPI001EF2919A|nr:DsbC family protein [Candidatus Nitrotoga sp. M5]CAH1385802.1 Thiol:disulfide interchange protein [Candidatus Nitrotoga sp. M5]
MIKLLLVLLVSFSFSHAHADAAKVKDLLQKKYPQLGQIEETHKSNILGLYEIVAQGQLFYTDEQARYLISGNIYDLKTMSNLTEERSRKLFAIDFDSLPFDLAIKRVKGNGKRKMAYFSDPNCGFCKKLENELKSVDNVTLYLFMLSIFQGSDKKVEGVWCSKDQVKAWDNLMLNNVSPPVGTCNAPTAKLMALSEKLNINGTPALFFADGVLVSGFRPAAILEKSLNAK